jgi:hypothetical protein
MRPLLDDLDMVSAARGHVRRQEPLLWLPGDPFDEDDLRNWRRRWFEPAAEAVGVEATPKTLRHSFASVWAAAGMSDVITAAQMATLSQSIARSTSSPLTRHANAPFTGVAGAEAMIYEAPERTMKRVSDRLASHGSLAGLADDLREELERDRSGNPGGPDSRQ